ncbi:uncharacterized protein LOC134828987 [Culicoides brevitarsis]|uniref:uncharacterized protein LOC134828987 n=1 Tax=Culicoides brevitarsis TaxID=469753 RepID=UPI00307CB7F1
MVFRKLFSMQSVATKIFRDSCLKPQTFTSPSFVRFAHSNNQETSKEKPLPRLIYMANPFKHCWAKFNMKMLKMTWDPEFSEEEFNKGASKAVLQMTDLVRNGDVLTMQKVTTKKGFEQVSQDTVLSSDDPRLNLLRFRHEDIKKIHPLNVHFVDKDGAHHIFIDMFFAMMRPVDCMVANSNSSLLLDIKKIEDSLRQDRDSSRAIPASTEDTEDQRRLILAEIFTRFHREYPEGKENVPNWDIEFYKVAKMKIIYAKY